MFSRIFKRRSSARRADAAVTSVEGKQPLPGCIYAFRTSPLYDHSPRETGRYAAFKIIGLDESLFVVAVLAGIWRAPPSVAAARQAPLLQETRPPGRSYYHPFGGVEHWDDRAVRGVHRSESLFDGLRDVVRLGEVPVSAEEATFAMWTLTFEPGAVIGQWANINRTAEAEWRWTNDRDAYLAETAIQKERLSLEQEAEDTSRASRLDSLIWEKLQSEPLFENWLDSQSYEFTLAARAQIRKTSRELQALGEKPSRSRVYKLLKQCVEWFNDADERAGHVIESMERDDLCEILEEMAYAAKQPGLVQEILELRDW